ncbi:MAG: DNA polymerase III subunit beta [Proteobacteria bacterium]|jgi:DNA polymerase-3 subunit beta|nr:DNA polymerase III subunit beta [Pseudomonadota bacterium]
MLLTTTRDTLLKPLTLVSGFVEKKQTMPILSNVYVRKSGDELTIIANDLEIQACINTKAEMAGDDFIITLPGKKLQEILKAIPENSKITLEQQDSRILVKSGKLKYTIQSLPAEHYPLLKLTDTPICQLHIEQNKIKHMLGQIQYAMADKDSRVFLNGMLFEVKNNQLRMVATDAHRLGFINTNLNEAINNHSVIVPRKTILELYRMLEDNTDNLLIRIYPNQVYFEVGGKQLITKIIDGKYPDYERVVPSDNDKLCLVNRVELLNAVDRVAIIGADKIKTLTVELSHNLLTLTCRNDEQEDSRDEIDVAYNYENSAIKICFNLNYIRDLLNNSSTETLQLAFYDGQRSVLATIPGEPDFKAVVMPLRT